MSENFSNFCGSSTESADLFWLQKQFTIWFRTAARISRHFCDLICNQIGRDLSDLINRDGVVACSTGRTAW